MSTMTRVKCSIIKPIQVQSNWLWLDHGGQTLNCLSVATFCFLVTHDTVAPSKFS